MNCVQILGQIVQICMDKVKLFIINDITCTSAVFLSLFHRKISPWNYISYTKIPT